MAERASSLLIDKHKNSDQNNQWFEKRYLVENRYIYNIDFARVEAVRGRFRSVTCHRNLFELIIKS